MPRDAAGRHDTANQRDAKVRTAEKRKCPRCLRKAALSSRYELRNDIGTRRIGSARECNYCGHEVGIRHGEPFGRGVTPEPGTRERP
jgi:hypothetical protein